MKDWTNITCTCGSVNDYNQTMTSGQNVCRCNKCNKFLGNKPNPNKEPRMYFGKYKGELLKDIDDVDYLEWAAGNMNTLSVKQTQEIENRVAEIYMNQ